MSEPPSVAPDLDELIDLFHAGREDLGRFTLAAPEELPPVFRELLAHHSHMTVTVERFHQSPVEVEVLRTRTDQQQYAREILLRRLSDGGVVQYGIVRLDLSVLSPEVRREIESQTAPLGRILIEHQVMRQVQLASLWRIEPSEELRRMLEFPSDDVVYGRTALIYCNDHPAVELLEVVVGGR